MSPKLWNKGFDADKNIDKFTVGKDRILDLILAEYDVTGSMAHIRMLEKIGLISKEELELLLPALQEIKDSIKRGEFKIEEGIEDVHSQIEFLLTRKLGDIGKKIHSGRSRNDQVLVDLKLYYRDEILNIVKEIKNLFNRLIGLSEKYKNELMPGYTHLQIAMPSSFGLWFGAYAESLADDLHLFQAAFKITNQNPLGSAAGYGSSFPLDRKMTTELLGFETLHFNVINAQMSRGKTERVISSAIAGVASTLSHLAMDICLWMCGNFKFVSFPDELTTGSSIMPHKKNPDVFEIIRGKCNRLQSVPNEISLLTANLPLGYNRDMQLLKEILFPAFKEIKECLSMTDFMLEHIRISKDILNDSKYDYIFTVEDVNRLVLEGTPFREAYRQIGSQVQNGTYIPKRDIRHTHIGSLGNLANDEIIKKMEDIVSGFGISVKD